MLSEIFSKLIQENGPVEGISAFLFIVSAMVSLIWVKKYRWTNGYGVSFILIYLGMREFDHNLGPFGKAVLRFWSTGRWGKLLRDDIPWTSKLFFVALIAFVMVFVVMFLWENIPTFTRAFRQRTKWAVTLSVGLVMLFLAQVADKLHSLDIPSLVVAEEFLELGFAISVFLAVIQSKSKEAL